jgi:hypothetical protein
MRFLCAILVFVACFAVLSAANPLEKLRAEQPMKQQKPTTEVYQFPFGPFPLKCHGDHIGTITKGTFTIVVTKTKDPSSSDCLPVSDTSCIYIDKTTFRVRGKVAFDDDTKGDVKASLKFSDRAKFEIPSGDLRNGKFKISGKVDIHKGNDDYDGAITFECSVKNGSFQGCGITAFDPLDCPDLD